MATKSATPFYTILPCVLVACTELVVALCALLSRVEDSDDA